MAFCYGLLREVNVVNFVRDGEEDADWRSEVKAWDGSVKPIGPLNYEKERKGNSEMEHSQTRLNRWHQGRKTKREKELFLKMVRIRNPRSESEKQQVLSKILRASVSEKLEDLLGDVPELNQEEDNNDVIQDLSEYVTLLVSNGRTKNQAKMLLGPFLGDANTALFVSWLWEFLSKKYMNPNASSDVENATGDGNATGKKQASKSSIIKPSDDSKKLSESVKCPDDDDLSSESSEEGELPRTHHQSIKEFEVSEIGYGESLKCASSRVEAYSGDLGVGGEESIPRKKVYTRSLRCKKLDVANVAGRRLFTRAAADAILHQRGRVHGNVWDRLGKLPEGGSLANSNMKGVEKIKEEVFGCYGESTELNQSTHSLHGRKFCGRLSEYFDIKTGASINGHKRKFSDISSHQSGVSDSMDEEDAFIKNDRRLLPEEDSGVVSENCVSSGAGTPKSQKMGSACSSNASASSKLRKMPKERLTGEIFESPVTAVSYSTPVTGKLFCKDNNNVTANLNPVHKQLMDMKLRLEQLETEIVKLQSKKVEKKEQGSSKSGSFNHLEGGESRTVVVKNVHIAATREALRSYFAKCGAVDRVIKLTDTDGIKKKAYAFVTFTSKHSADKALALSGKSFFSRIIWVRRTGELLQKSRCAPHIGRRECSTTTVPIYSGGSGGSGSRRPTKYTL
ncbi:ZINC FINGER CCCH DOMAIN-CONTAINING PROTEIN 14 [Salix koriyanagi]|uniref:ZINC FINGER CCCH DOMAIN-CONTAINING PROTEIN 14 n=1 Tax=Salix koriyanagi TaxID=2511006 RepID=A0A9Q0VE82_9ROSI|nr:ZINC FINGER CCCH DOMAIN-CONTAINING PROTEIN 14 [Salix koriyanagi]